VSVLVEWIVPTLLALPVFLWLREPEGDARAAGLVWRWRWPLLAATRLLWPIVVFVALDLHPVSDLWFRETRTAAFLSGAVPGLDYPNMHAPLLPYLEGVGRFLTPGRPAIGSLLFFVLGDLAAVFAGARLGRERRKWIGAWLVLTPLLWFQLTVRGQDESLFAGFLAVALLLVRNGRPAATGALLGLGLCCTKLSFAPYALTVLLVPGVRSFRAWGAFLVVTGGVSAAYAATGAPILAVESLDTLSRNYSIGISIPDAVARVVPSLPQAVSMAFYALCTGAAAIALPLLVRHGSAERRALLALVGVHAVSMLTMPYCVSPYFAQGIVVLLLFLGGAGGSRPARLARAVLPFLAWLAVMHWTRSRVFSVPIKPLMIGFHGLVLYLLYRSLGSEENAATRSPAES